MKTNSATKIAQISQLATNATSRGVTTPPADRHHRDDRER
jgi:hypothetical protein